MERRDDGSLSPPAGCIYDKDLKPKKKFFGEFPDGSAAAATARQPSSRHENGHASHPRLCGLCRIWEKIYVADSRKGLFIAVFDENGDLLMKSAIQSKGSRFPRAISTP